MTKYINLVLGLIVAAALGFGGYQLYRAGGTTAKLETAAVVAQQTRVATAKTQEYQSHVDEANLQVRREESATAAGLDRLHELDARMRSLSAAVDLTHASAEALRDHASDLERDLADCRTEYVTLVGVAAGASTAAHGLYDGWPGQSAWADAQAEFVKQAQELIK